MALCAHALTQYLVHCVRMGMVCTHPPWPAAVPTLVAELLHKLWRFSIDSCVRICQLISTVCGYRVTAMMSLNLHFPMANPNFIARFVGPSSRFFTNKHSNSINQVERYPFVQKI